jgi:hypothetical protein
MKDILQEEISLMKKLFDIRGGFVISEAINLEGNVELIRRELNKANSDEQFIVDTLKNYTNKSDFQNFLNKYKEITGKDFAVDVYRAIQPYNDKTEWNDLKKHLATLGVTLGSTTTNRGRTGLATFAGLDNSAATTPVAGGRQTNVNNMFCSVKGGIIINPSSINNNVKWVDFVKAYKITEQEIKTAKGTCPDSELAKTNKNTPGSGQQNVTQRFSKAASSLGVQNGKMDVQTLQTILNQLSGTQSTTATASGQQPDLAALQNTLSQLTTP